jgi:Ca2+/Na+ antiporter
MNDFLSGAVFSLCCVAGLFFLRFWRKTHDRFFAFFAASFWLMAFHRLVMLFLRHDIEEYVVGAYLIRLLAFVLILIAIVDKNRGPRRSRKGPSS